MEFLAKYWWISIVTIPLPAVILWIIHRTASRKAAASETPDSPGKPAIGLKGFLFLVILNFGVWAMGTVGLHGEALSGKKENGKYFVGYRRVYTEVSKEIYTYSYIHTWITILSFPALILILGIADIRGKGLIPPNES